LQPTSSDAPTEPDNGEGRYSTETFGRIRIPRKHISDLNPGSFGSEMNLKKTTHLNKEQDAPLKTTFKKENSPKKLEVTKGDENELKYAA
jgi:hypothetical protein